MVALVEHSTLAEELGIMAILVVVGIVAVGIALAHILVVDKQALRRLVQLSLEQEQHIF